MSRWFWRYYIDDVVDDYVDDVVDDYVGDVDGIVMVLNINSVAVRKYPYEKGPYHCRPLFRMEPNLLFFTMYFVNHPRSPSQCFRWAASLNPPLNRLFWNWWRVYNHEWTQQWRKICWLNTFNNESIQLSSSPAGRIQKPCPFCYCKTPLYALFLLFIIKGGSRHKEQYNSNELLIFFIRHFSNYPIFHRNALAARAACLDPRLITLVIIINAKNC